MDANETPFFLQAALFALAGLAGYLCVSSLRFSLLRSALVAIGLLPSVVLVGAVAAVRISDGRATGGLGLVALLLIGFSICACVMLAWRLLGQSGPRRGHDDGR